MQKSMRLNYEASSKPQLQVRIAALPRGGAGLPAQEAHLVRDNGLFRSDVNGDSFI